MVGIAFVQNGNGLLIEKENRTKTLIFLKQESIEKKTTKRLANATEFFVWS